MTVFRSAPILTLVAALLALAALSACAPATEPVAEDRYTSPQIALVAEGLLAPVGLAALPDGSLLVAEEGTGQRDYSAGVSLITPDGTVGRLISGIQSSMDAGDLAGAALVALAPDGGTLYVGNFGQGHLWTLPLTAEQQANGLALPATALSPDDLTPAMLALNQVMLVNPFDLTFDAAGAPVVSDASSDGVAKPTADGATRFIHRFARLPNPQASDPRATISPVPTGIARIGDEYYVTLTGGCPYPEGGGRLVAIDENRNERVVVDDLNMPIDVAQGPDGTIWLLEFARFAPDASCFSGSGYQARTGRLSIVQPDGSLRAVLENLNFPGAVLPQADGSLVISEVLPGRVVRVTWGEEAEGRRGKEGEEGKEGRGMVAERREVAAFDAVLRRAAAERGLRPWPGADQQEAESALSELGQALFFDPILSGDRNISCGTCHHPLFAGADGRVLPIGAGGVGLGPERRFGEQVALADEASTPRRRAGVTGAAGETVVLNPFEGAFVPRNTPTLLTRALFPRQFWDSRIETYAADEAIRTPDSQVNRLGLTDA
ncbi:MAG TPA: ScyD/ScyE family protein, partial [Rubrivivax sp.]|nr:ScyD/ScyE family protein [Rubrivivax sp.]